MKRTSHALGMCTPTHADTCTSEVLAYLLVLVPVPDTGTVNRHANYCKDDKIAETDNFEKKIKDISIDTDELYLNSAVTCHENCILQIKP